MWWVEVHITPEGIKRSRVIAEDKKSQPDAATFYALIVSKIMELDTYIKCLGFKERGSGYKG